MEDRRKLKAKEIQRKERVQSPEELQEKKRTKVLEKLTNGKVSRAARLIDSHRLADMNQEVTRAALKSKFPDRRTALPESVPSGVCIDGLYGLRDHLLSLEPGSAAGPGGCRGEYLTVLGKTLDNFQMERLKRFCYKYLQGDVPVWFSSVMASIVSVPLFKSAEKDSSKIWPIGFNSNKIECHDQSY